MSEPIWLSEAAVVRLHGRSIEAHGGSPGVRDAGLLTSALQRPQNRWAYEAIDDPRDLAATYAVAISANHPFIDGNKRAAFQALGSFLLQRLGPDVRHRRGGEGHACRSRGGDGLG